VTTPDGDRPRMRRTLTIPNESKQLSVVRTVVTEVLAASPFDQSTRTKIIVAVDEALANVVEHAYQGGTGPIELDLALEPDHLSVAIRDNGVRYEPKLERGPLDIKKHIQMGLKGGLGLHLMKMIMDEVRYRHETPFVNELTLLKRFPTTTPPSTPATPTTPPPS
jgi:anti-sigma regulatory factor (Ser/Thr protein kinase)